jgi:hypothetical protein
MEHTQHLTQMVGNEAERAQKEANTRKGTPSDNEDAIHDPGTFSSYSPKPDSEEADGSDAESGTSGTIVVKDFETGPGGSVTAQLADGETLYAEANGQFHESPTSTPPTPSGTQSDNGAPSPTSAPATPTALSDEFAPNWEPMNTTTDSFVPEGGDGTGGDWTYGDGTGDDGTGGDGTGVDATGGDGTGGDGIGGDGTGEDASGEE